MKKIVTFGEIMLRLAPNEYSRFFQDDQSQAMFSGGEADVAVSLTDYGMCAAFVTRLPNHAIGQGAVNAPRALEVDTPHIVRGGDRAGIYYPEKGVPQQGSVCIYDRAYSIIQQTKTEDFDWDNIFEGAVRFHFIGITPVLGGNLVEICPQACRAAKAKGIRVSCDLNYRGKLWNRAQARAAVIELCRHVDVCIANEEDAKDIFSIEAADSDIYGGKLNKSGYESVARQLTGQFELEKVAITLCTSLSASDNNQAGIPRDGMECHVSEGYYLYVVDQTGGGDSFADGLVYALLSGKSAQDIVESTVAASTLKHSVEGDFNRVTCNEVGGLVNGNDSGGVQRQVAASKKLREQ